MILQYKFHLAQINGFYLNFELHYDVALFCRAFDGNLEFFSLLRTLKKNEPKQKEYIKS